MATPTVILLKKESYLAMIRNAEGSRLFQNLFARIGEETVDIVKGGKTSCAFFASAILYYFSLIKEPHATVTGLERDLVASGWVKVDSSQEGDVVVWEPKLQGGSATAHLGFALSADEAMSNDWEARVPAKHHITYGVNEDGSPGRAITAVYRYDFASQ